MDGHMSEFQRFVQKRKNCEWSGLESRRNCQMGGQMESRVAGVGRQIGGWARDGTQVRRWVVIGIMGLRAQSDRMLSHVRNLSQKGNLRMDMALMENRPAQQGLVQKLMTMLHLETCGMQPVGWRKAESSMAIPAVHIAPPGTNAGMPE